METENNQENKPVAAAEPANVDNVITYDDFSKLELRVAQVLSAERVPKSEKLIKMQLTLGEALGERQIVAGIGKFYTPEDLVGRKIVVVANLKPVKLMGQESRGMLLAASDEDNGGGVAVLSVDPLMPTGAKVR